jgi:hypothetical protein
MISVADIGKLRRSDGESYAGIRGNHSAKNPRPIPRLNEYRQLVRVALNSPPNFAPSKDATKSWKVPQSKKS